MKNRCEYCGNPPELVSGKKIYPHRMDLEKLRFYYCYNGHEPAWVGCHFGTVKALGRMANAELREWKTKAHKAFDPLWRDHKILKSRTKAYRWMAKKMKIDEKRAHIGMFDVAQCKKLVKLCNEAVQS